MKSDAERQAEEALAIEQLAQARRARLTAGRQIVADPYATLPRLPPPEPPPPLTLAALIAADAEPEEDGRLVTYPVRGINPHATSGCATAATLGRRIFLVQFYSKGEKR